MSLISTTTIIAGVIIGIITTCVLLSNGEESRRERERGDE